MIESFTFVIRDDEDGSEIEIAIPLGEISYIKYYLGEGAASIIMKNSPYISVCDVDAIRRLKEIFKEK